MRAAAKELGVTPLTYRMWERGAWRPVEENWRKIADWCGHPLTRVLGALGVLDIYEEQARKVEEGN